MRIVTTSALLSLLLIANASAQTPTSPTLDPQVPAAAGGPAPAPGTPLNPQTDAGLAKPAADGSTRMVPAVPCTTAARETDGTTTCVGLSGPINRSGRPGSPSEETVGRVR